MDKSTDVEAKMCRVCLMSDCLLENLYSLINFPTLTKLKSFIEIEEEELPTSKLPKWICEQCIPTLKIAFDFKSLCEKNDLFLKEMFISDEVIQIKVEPNIYAFGKIEEIDVKVESSDDDDEDEYMDDNVNENNDDESADDNDNSEDLSDSEIKLFCKKCNTSFKHKSSLGRHMKRCSMNDLSDDKIKEFTCEICNRTFQLYHSLTRHKKMVHSIKHIPINQKKYNCKECKEVFTVKSLYREHVSTHDLKCRHCDDRFPSTARLSKHEIDVHGGEAISTCDVCSKNFTTLNSLNRHKRMMHDKSRNFICDVCNGSYYSITVLNKHKLRHMTERNFPCDICQKAFKTSEDVKKHKKTHISMEDRNNSESTKKYLCNTCGKILYTLSGYQVHSRIHIGEKKYKCDICQKSFQEKAQLKVHVGTHYDDRPYKCKLCSLSFKQQAHLSNHKIAHENEKRFSCEICGVSMKYKENLTHHIKNVHLGIRNYKCEECDEAFYTSNLLKQHKTRKHMN